MWYERGRIFVRVTNRPGLPTTDVGLSLLKPGTFRQMGMNW